MNRNEQFNQHYADTIELVKSRAIWRVGEQIVEGETFRCTCFNCGYESLHQRFDITRHRLLFGKSIRSMEPPRPMLRCRRCGQQRHLRDVGELVVPSTITLHDDLCDALRMHLRSSPSSSDLPAELIAKIEALREEASGPIRQQVLSTVAAAEMSAAGTATLEAVGRALFLSSDQIATALRGQSVTGTD